MAVAEFPGAEWTTFDRHARYGAIARAIRASLGAGPLRVLDVGDSSGYLTAFDPDLGAVCIDVVIAPDPLDGTVRVIGDGAALPFPDDSFHAVVSSDALEHVPPLLRTEFIAELARVSADLVVLAAPFDSPGVSAAEEIVRRYALLATGRPQEQLEEHRHYGLPGVDSTVEILKSLGLQVDTVGAGNLHDWMAMMVLKHQLSARPALFPLEAGYDMAYNGLFSGRDRVPPFYRHVIAARSNGSPAFGEPRALLPAGGDLDVAGLLAVLTAANTSEAVRQDAHEVRSDNEKRLEALEGAVSDLSGAMAAQAEAMKVVLGRVETALSELGSETARIGEILRHPVAGVVRRVKRVIPGS